MPNPRTVLLAQAIISCIMAFLMTGIFAAIHLGLNAVMVKQWLHNFVMAWPIAFCLSIPVSKFAFDIAFKLTGKRPN